MTKKYRVSAKQRLELVKEVYDEWNRSVTDDAQFAASMKEALFGELTPANAEKEEEVL